MLSGQPLDYLDTAIFALMFHHGTIRRVDSPIRLRSGANSRYYISAREDLADNPFLLRMIGQRLAQLIWESLKPEDKQPCLIGVPTTGTPLAQAAAMADLQWKLHITRLLRRELPDICFRLMRETRKDHGAHRSSWLNGPPQRYKHTYILVDNAATSGGSILEAFRKLVEAGYYEEDEERPPVLLLVERGQGALEKLRRYGFNRIIFLYHILDIVGFLCRHGLWPESFYKELEAEIS